jgi:predicted transposase/invertase (TIGR01784 family)
MFDDDVRSYLTDEDRQEIAQEFFAKGVKQGIDQGVEQGVEQGSADAKREAARNLKVLGVSVDTICKALGLDKATVEAL